MKWSLAVLVAVFLIGINVSDARETHASQEAGSSTINERTSIDQKPEEAGSSNTNDGTSTDQNPKEAGSSNTNYGISMNQIPSTGPSADQKPGEQDFLVTDYEPSKVSLFQLVQKGAHTLQKTACSGLSWISGFVQKSGKEAGKMLGLSRVPSDVGNKMD